MDESAARYWRWIALVGVPFGMLCGVAVGARATDDVALRAAAIRVLDGRLIRLWLGLCAAGFAGRLFREIGGWPRDDRHRNRDERFGFTSHWGGLGGGQGGWELEPETIRWSLRVFALVMLSVAAAWLIAAPVSIPSVAPPEPSTPAAAGTGGSPSPSAAATSGASAPSASGSGGASNLVASGGASAASAGSSGDAAASGAASGK